MIQTVKPELVSGTRDLLPVEAIAQSMVVETVKKVYESFGFVPLETPCIERWSVLTGNDPDFNKSIYRATINRGAEDRGIDSAQLSGEESTLRFDLTVPLARVVAAYPDLPRPFKRYQIGRVFRGERPQAGRFREFTQFDFDIIGSNSVLADVEVIQVMYAAMKALGIENFVIRFNTRRLLNGLAELVGCANKAKDFFRIVDKADKIGVKGVLEALQRQPDNQFDESALALTKEQCEKVAEFLDLRADSADETFRKAALIFEGNATATQGLEELQTIAGLLRQLEVPEQYWKIDLSVARGLDYYTGPVFETYLTDLPGLGSVFSGGRFDGLVNRFMSDSNIPGVGASVGIDRLIVGMRQLNKLANANTLTQALVTVFNAELQSDSAVCAQKLRQAGINTELYMGADSSLRGQLTYAAKQGIAYVVVIGPDEAKSGRVQLKNMLTRKQELLTFDECITRIREVHLKTD